MANAPLQPVVLTESGNQQKANYTLALVTLAVLYFMNGFITCLNDTLVPFFKKGFTLTYAQSSLVQFYFFLTYGLMSFPAGKIVERIGYKKGMVLGFAIAAVGATLFLPASWLHLYGLFLAALFILAIGIVVLQVASNPYITILGPARTASSRLTLIQAVGSIGTTAAPLFGAHYILSRLSESASSSEALRVPYVGIALVLLAIAAVVYKLKLPEVTAAAPTTVNSSTKGPTSVFSFRNLNFGAWAIFAYVGAEVSIGTFLTNYIADTLQVSESQANSYVAFYWGSMLVGRLIGAYLLKVLRPASVLNACALVAILLVLVSVSTTGKLAIWSMIAVGFCNSVMFAIIFSLSVHGLGRFTTQASGILSTAIVGGAVISYAQGLLKDNATWAIAFLVPVACYIYILFFGLNGYKPKMKAGPEQD
ncbi:glucose/galactose MFS transporter [Adhaeribacter aerolatus]|uniref:Glucose/galactose MFS transporter n=1 Tax=Adhaeribacter aerolatus TaxID=670289 RepID=A0A512AS40_9BACT|nr:sugar MFS transporter [Adhaeribacter aerolatus]GEO02516.1 glucose/galactose MFS transporter [Adhaeribacter aerolatus]